MLLWKMCLLIVRLNPDLKLLLLNGNEVQQMALVAKTTHFKATAMVPGDGRATGLRNFL